MTAVAPSKITFFYDNVLDDALNLDVSSELPTMPATLLRTQLRSEVFRTIGCADPLTILACLGTPTACTYFGMVNYNLSASAEIRIQLNTVNQFEGTTPIDETFTLGQSVHGFGQGGFGQYGFGGGEGVGGLKFMTRALRPPFSHFIDNADNALSVWAKLTITNPANPDQYLQFGRLLLGKHLTLERNYEYGDKETMKDPSTIAVTDDAIEWPDELEKSWLLTVNIGNVTDDEKFYKVREFLQAVGTTRHFVMIKNPETEEGRFLTSYYCRIVNEVDLEHARWNGNNVQLQLKEVH